MLPCSCGCQRVAMPVRAGRIPQPERVDASGSTGPMHPGPAGGARRRPSFAGGVRPLFGKAMSTEIGSDKPSLKTSLDDTNQQSFQPGTLEEFKRQLPDADPQETQEWIDALDGVVE